MQLIVITPENDIAHEWRVVNELFANGLQRLHLRKHQDYNANDYRNYIHGIDKQYHPRIVIYCCFELLAEFELGGMHLSAATRDDKEIGQIVSVLSPSFISTSFHSWQEIRDNRFRYKYVFISPVFDSISKKGYNADINLDGLKQTRHYLQERNVYCPQIIGLGGVNTDNLNILHEAGFSGASVLGSIWLSEDPVAAFVKMRDVTRSLPNP